MKQATIQHLNQINRQFYETTATNFDQTRGQAWAGWQALLPYLKTPLRVLDVGCGNGRFAAFLAQKLDGPIIYHGIDNNAQLLEMAGAALHKLPKLTFTLTQQDIIEGGFDKATYDLVALFGVIHHVPGASHRRNFMVRLAQQVAAGGLLCFAAWRFYEYARFRERFVDWPDNVEVEAHDYLLDWRRGERALRYCHYVDDSEHAALIAASGLKEVTTYRADGADNAMNRYSLLTK